jgi:hypothetical protein
MDVIYTIIFKTFLIKLGERTLGSASKYPTN